MQSDRRQISSGNLFKSIALAISIVSQVIVYFLLNRIDLAVNGQLYDYIERFSPQFASTYVGYVGIINVCLIVTIVLSTIALIMSLARIRNQTAPQSYRPATITSHAPKPHPVAPVLKINEDINFDDQITFAAANKQTTSSVPQPVPKKTQPAPEKAFNESKDKLTCPKCKKTFSTPLLMMDYEGKVERIVRSCPYCNQIIDSEGKATEV